MPWLDSPPTAAGETHFFCSTAGGWPHVERQWAAATGESAELRGPGLRAVLDEWLALVFTAESVEQAIRYRTGCRPVPCWSPARGML